MKNVETVYNFFKQKGLSDEATCGIIGNLQQESGQNIDPSKKQSDGGPGRGICQWEIPPFGVRFTNLERYASSKGTIWTCLNTQLEFMWSEMIVRDISDRMKGRASKWDDNNAFQNNLRRKGAIALKNGFEDFKVMTDLEQAVRIFDAAFLRSGTPKMDNRIENAKRVFKNFNGTFIDNNTINKNIQIGSNVRIKQGAIWFTGQSIPEWVFNSTYRVDDISGDRVVLDRNGINSPIDIKFLELV